MDLRYEVEGLLEVLFGLAGEPDNDVGREADIGHGVADHGDAA